MTEQYRRTEMVLGAQALERLRDARVAVFGIGGGYAVEALARSGIGALDLIDHDTVALSNLNRQIIATQETIGRYKVDVAEDRIRSINPGCVVRTYRTFFLPEEQAHFDFSQYDYVVDAIDTVAGKIAIIMGCQAAGTPVISAMGTGNKIDPTALEVADIYETDVDPLARVMRRELRRRGVPGLRVVYSREKPIPPAEAAEEQGTRRGVPGSTAFVPSAAGLIIASVVVRDLIGFRPRK